MMKILSGIRYQDSSSCLCPLLLIVLALLSQFVGPSQSKCICTVTKNGEYCGTELNTLDSANDCPKKMFFCSDSNRNKDAVLLVDCPPGKECDIKTLFGNACLKDLKCDCAKELKSGHTYCGDLMTGKDCSPNVTFSCPYLSLIFNPSPVEACLYGCKDGVCLTENKESTKE